MARLQGLEPDEICSLGSDRQMAQLIGNAMSCNVLVKLLIDISGCIGYAAGVSAPPWCADVGADPATKRLP